MTTVDLWTDTHADEEDLLALAADDLSLDSAVSLAAHVATCDVCAERARGATWLAATFDALARLEADLASTVIPSPIGALRIVASPRGVRRVSFLGDAEPDAGASHGLPVLESARQQLDEYFAGRRRAFDLPLDLAEAAPFQRRVLEAAVKIPAGQTATYGGLARALGRPKAARAVGGALHRNPVPIVVPCHRVVGGDGRLVGYAGGLETKRFLLHLEGALVA